jgi:hypothetical protein
MSIDRQSLDALVCTYLAGGGRVLKIPAAISATRDEVLEYLQSQQTNNISMSKKNATTEAKHRQGVKTLNSDALIRLANAYRRKQGLPPFGPK